MAANDTGTMYAVECRRYPGLTLDMKVCDCAGCGELLLSRVHESYFLLLARPQQVVLPPLLFERHEGRPYCGGCAHDRRFGQPREQPKPSAALVADKLLNSWDAEV